MNYKILIDFGVSQIRLALLKESRIHSFYVINQNETYQEGDVILARVEKVMPSLDAAFVRLCEKEIGFYHYQTIPKPNDNIILQFQQRHRGDKFPKLKEKWEIFTSHLVAVSNEEGVYASKNLKEETRLQLKELFKKRHQEKFALILRSSCDQMDVDQLTKEYEDLCILWRSIKEKERYRLAPSLLYRQSKAYEQVIDLWSEEGPCEIFSNFPNRLKSYENVKQLSMVWEEFFLISSIEKLLDRKIWLKNGSFIVMEQTEALFSIDVNTGKQIGSKDKDTSVWKTNAEALKTISKLIALRNVSGLIVIDFINFKSSNHSLKFKDLLQEEFSKDKFTTKVDWNPSFHLALLTRTRKRESLYEQLFWMKKNKHQMIFCKRIETFIYDVEQAIRKQQSICKVHKIKLTIPSHDRTKLLDRFIDELEKQYELTINVTNGKEHGFELV